MNKTHGITKLLLAIFVMLLVPAVEAAKPVKQGNQADGKTAPVSLREVEYSTLENKVGSQLVIQTTNNTTRRGTLQRYTKVSLSVKLGPENGSIELGVPRATIRSVMVEIAPADPLFPNETSPHEGKPGAKKN